MSNVVELTPSNFDSILKSTRKVLVDFWAPWCGPCMKLNPVIERAAQKHETITFAKVNVDKFAELATRYHVSSLPSCVYFSDSRPLASMTGAVSESEFEQFVSEMH